MNIPKSNNPGNLSVFVGNLDPSVTEADLSEEFKKYGKVTICHVVRDRETKNPRGYAFVNFSSPEEVDKALNGANMNILKGKEMRVMPQLPKFKPSAMKGNLFVKNLPEECDSKQLMDIFSTYGNILSCKVSFNKETNKSLRYGYVHFNDPSVASHLIDVMSKDVVDEGAMYVMEYEAHKHDHSADWVSCYVGNFPKSWKNEDLQKVFETYGPITSTYVTRKSYNEEIVQGFVTFKNHDDAVKAVEGLKEHVVTIDNINYNLYVNKLQPREERHRLNQKRLIEIKKKNIELTKGRFLYVGFSGEEMSLERLRSLFQSFGELESASIAKDKTTGVNKNFGFICMKTVESAQEAINHFKNLGMDNKLKVELAQTREERDKFIRSRRQNSSVMVKNNFNNNFMNPPYSLNNRNKNMGTMNNMGNMGNMSNMYPIGYVNGGQYGMMPPNGMMPVNSMINNPIYPNYSMPNQMNPSAPVVNDSISILRNYMVSMPVISAESISSLSDEERRNCFGERLFTLINNLGDPRVSKITGMMLELNVNDLLNIVNNPEELNNKIIEANEVLDQSNH